MKKILISIFVILILGISGFCLYHNYFKQKSMTPEQNNTAGVINSATFDCAENKNIKALFFADRVELTLSDGRNMLLPQGVSASGARYANEDESFVFWNKGDTAFIEEGNTTTYQNCIVENSEKPQPSSSVQMANPASTHCSEVGGNLVIQEDGTGGEYGLCYFDDNRACEEWALLRGDCPLGGVKTTGFDAIDQKYCAWTGGETLAVPNSICTFKDGTSCSTKDLYNGKCFTDK